LLQAEMQAALTQAKAHAKSKNGTIAA
jgi:hypothetical protein